VLRAANYFMRIQRSTLHGEPFDASAVRREALACRAWLASELARTDGDWDATVAVTHFGPSFRSADPRFGAQPGTASFCNADDDLLPLAAQDPRAPALPPRLPREACSGQMRVIVQCARPRALGNRGLRRTPNDRRLTSG
jgi:hypothetical protein